MTPWTPDLAGRTGPRYRAIADALADDIAAGRLAAGTRLPTHRELAYQLGVTVGTITRAYAEAEKRGLIGGEVGRGTFVQGHRLDRGRALPMPEGEDLEAVNMTVVHPQHSVADQMFGPTLAAIAASGQAVQFLAYPPHAGLPAHRAAGARWLERHHRLEATADSVVLTTGAQNAMAVALAAVARPGDVVLTERLTNYGMKTIAATMGYYLEGIAIDEHGIVPDAFDSACRRLGPKALYFVPTIQNPTAVMTPYERRLEIVEIARRHSVVLIEDDVFGHLVDDATPLQAIAPDITLHVNSVSKSMSAGLRVGYVVAPPSLRPRVEATVRALQYAAPGLAAEVATRWINDGTGDRIVEVQRAEDRVRRQIARAILPPSVVSGDPAAPFLWLVLPEPWRRDDFIAEARRRGAIVTGADVFAVGRSSAPHAVRVALSKPPSREEAERGLRALAATLDAPATAPLSIV
ncbi:PLP-dependent aminotransferase family protein [Azospirillum thermophilum]|uniref:PLP-dependent aminotransferase family protein n=1 Tax=Azospirillum thermophilum TaxID=2202148 RepID=A0A2S2CX68_9PROT|nr:PLP-dependent aminotransferase family protein [Azospirillum thermophilum]AWK89048.1 PLP-dependent aminotransferase family protein [Azospirillum thermophilum]